MITKDLLIIQVTNVSFYVGVPRIEPLAFLHGIIGANIRVTLVSCAPHLTKVLQAMTGP